MKILVDYDSCEANGVCEREAPRLFRVEDDDTLTVLNDSPDSAQYDKARAAAAGCPRNHP